MRVQVIEVVPMPNDQPSWITPGEHNQHEVDRWEANEHGDLVLYRGAEQVATYRHWINVKEVSEGTVYPGMPA